MHGLGNDFLVILKTSLAMPAAEVRAMADRRTGLGFDQLIVLDTEVPEAPRLSFYNADGSFASACGNGSRCAAGWIFDAHPEQEQIKLHVSDGEGGFRVLTARRHEDGVWVEMGLPTNVREEVFSRLGLTGTALEVGNPHCVLFDATPDVAVAEVIQSDPRFADGVNVGFARVEDPNTLSLQVFERGVGFTPACGTGAAAAAAAAVRLGCARSPVRVSMLGGALNIYVSPDGVLAQSGSYNAVAQGTYKPLVAGNRA